MKFITRKRDGKEIVISEGGVSVLEPGCDYTCDPRLTPKSTTHLTKKQIDTICKKALKEYASFDEDL